MEIKAKFHSLTEDFVTGDYIIAFTTSDLPQIRHFINAHDKETDLKLKCVKWTNKRSLDANSYFHVLVGKIADAMSPPISKAKAKNILITRYGQPQLLDDGQPMIYKTNAPPEFMWEQESIHSIPVKYEEKATFYKIYRGSHTLNSKEFSILLDGTIAECKELGIETITPEEKRIMLEKWANEINNAR